MTEVYRPGDQIEWTDGSRWHGPYPVIARPTGPAVTPERPGQVWFLSRTGPVVFDIRDVRRYVVRHEEPSPPAGYIPWGPEHPDWHPFWDKAQDAARRNNYCDEYDRMVRQIGGRERRPLREVVVFDLRVSVTLTGPRDFGVDVHQVREALLDALPPGRTVGPITINEIEVDEIDEIHRQGVED